MQNYKFYFCGVQPHLASTALVSMYNTQIYGQYDNPQVNASKQADMYCMLITLRGNAEIILHSGKVIQLTEKSVFFSKESEIANMRHRGDFWHFTCSWFVTQGISVPINEIYTLSDLDVQKENDETDFIIRLFQTQIDQKIQYANSYFCCRLLDFLEKIKHQSRNTSEFVDQVLLYINRHIEENIKIKDIADFFHYSEKHIHHLFKTALNTTPKHFINNIKLDNVAHLLTTTSVSLQELADRYNYASISHLINNFKKKYGMTPSAYRTAQ